MSTLSTIPLYVTNLYAIYSFAIASSVTCSEIRQNFSNSVLLYCKLLSGEWARQFDKKGTTEEEFFVKEGKTVKAKLMFKVS